MTPQLLFLESELQKLLSESKRAASTTRSYRYAWGSFTRWSKAIGREALPASGETLALYVTDLISHHWKISTAEHALAAIRYQHLNTNHAYPADELARTVLRGARRVLKQKPKQKAALRTEDLKRICAREPVTDIEIRNRAILLFGFATALRRSEIARLDLADIEFIGQALLVHLKWEKQDQMGRGRDIPVCQGHTGKTCPVAAVRRWLEVRGNEPGALFYPYQGRMRKRHMHPMVVSRIVKDEVRKVGLEPVEFGAHSLRSGFITAAVLAGASETNIARHTGHRSFHVLRKYFRARDPFEGSVSQIIGL